MTKRRPFCYNFLAFARRRNFKQGEVKEKMSTIKVGENESVESALRRFKRKCSRDGIIGDLRKKEFYESPSVKRRKKSEAARKRNKN